MGMPMAEEKPRVTIYTDGGADPNPGPGGWAAILIHDASGRIKEISGGEPYTTNNRMELTAAIEALAALKQPCAVALHSDSSYLVQGITRWVGKWVASGWVHGKKREPVENADLWQRLLELAQVHDVSWKWLRGHSGNHFNERADALVRQEIRRLYEEEPGRPTADAEVYLLISARGEQGLWAASVRSADFRELPGGNSTSVRSADFLARVRGAERLLHGVERNATSNQLDLIAATEALRTLPEGIRVRVYTLSDYLRNGATQWLRAWKQRGWRTREGAAVKNRELWERLEAELSRRSVEWPSVKDDPAYEFAFEDLAQRAQEAFATRVDRGEGFLP